MEVALLEAVTGRFMNGDPVGDFGAPRCASTAWSTRVTRLFNTRRGTVPYLTPARRRHRQVYQGLPNTVQGFKRVLTEAVRRYEPHIDAADCRVEQVSTDEFRLQATLAIRLGRRSLGATPGVVFERGARRGGAGRAARLIRGPLLRGRLRYLTEAGRIRREASGAGRLPEARQQGSRSYAGADCSAEVRVPHRSHPREARRRLSESSPRGLLEILFPHYLASGAFHGAAPVPRRGVARCSRRSACRAAPGLQPAGRTRELCSLSLHHREQTCASTRSRSRRRSSSARRRAAT